MGATKGQSNFTAHQAAVIENHAKLIEAELKDLRGRAGVKFENLDSLVRYLAKLTGLHRTTLKRNIAYRRLMRDFLGHQQGAAAIVNVDDASSELLRAMVEERNMTIGSLVNQIRVLKARLNMLDGEQRCLPGLGPSPIPAVSDGTGEVAFQNTAIALLQLIQHIK